MPSLTAVEAIFQAALERPTPVERAAYLDQACQGDSDLRQQVERLLDAQHQLGSFLEQPAAEGATSDVAAGQGIDTANPPRLTEGPGTRIGPYKLLQQLGEGGMGTVFMAEQTQPVRRKVALKVIKPGMDSHQVIARFEAERQALALMDHPNIAKVLDAGATPAGWPYFVMELVKGVPITRFCDERRLTPKERLGLFVPVRQAVQHAHQKGVIHRDLKPSNVLVALYDDKPVPKVIDFGVAKAAGTTLTERTLFTEFGAVIGTLEYMSPEQAELNQLDVDTRSDIYSLGVLLYELLTGTTPLERKRLKMSALMEALRLIREEEPPKPSTRLGTTVQLPSIAANRGLEPKKLSGLVRGELDWIAMKALEKDRNRRYETANGLAMDLQRYLADEPVLAAPASLWYRLRKVVRRHRGPVVAAGLVLLTLVGGIAGTTWGLVRAEHQRQLAEVREREAVDERDAKDLALKAEQQARADETKARQRAFLALRSMTAEVVEGKFGQGTALTEDDRAFLRGVIAQYDAFAAIKGDDIDSRTMRAEGRCRVAEMSYRLGELKQAEQAYDEALRLLKQLVADLPARPDFRLHLAGSHGSRGLLLYAMGRLQEAEQESDQAVGIQKQLVADFPSQPRFRHELAQYHNNRGTILKDAGRLKEAEQDYDQALGLFKQLAADFPSQADFRRQLARSRMNRGLLLKDTGRPQEAEQEFDQALSIQRQLAADFPTRPQLRQDLALTHDSRGGLLHTMGRLKEAEQDYDQALSIRKQLAAVFPARLEFRQDLARSHNNRGLLLSATGRLKEAEQDYDQALSIRKQLAADFPARPDFRNELAQSLENRGDLLKDTDRLKEAKEDYDQALGISKQLVADFPNQPELRNWLAGAYARLGSLYRQQGNWAAARRVLLEGRPHHLAALEANPRNPTYRQYYRWHLSLLTAVHAGLLEQADAVRTAETCRDLGYDAPADAYDAACGLSLCVPAVAKHDKLDEKGRKDAAQFYSDAAMKFLREAVSKGYKDVTHMKKDTDLDPLRQREDFQKLVTELEGKGK
jgi:serine/threonine protein kinase/Tfp pilus assembly protein PilF